MAATSLAPIPNITITEPRSSLAQRILVMAENRALQRTLLRLFSAEGYEVEIVADDLVGLEMLRKSPPSALILDLKYPYQSAGNSAAKLRSRLQMYPS